MTGEKQFCTFYVEQHLFGVEVLQVQEVFRYQEMTQVPLAPAVVQGLINLRGQIITAVDLRRRLGMADRTQEKPPMNVVVQIDGDAVSLLVDEIGDVLEVSEDFFETTPDTLQNHLRELVEGVYKLDRGLLLVLDTGKATNMTGDSQLAAENG